MWFKRKIEKQPKHDLWLLDKDNPDRKYVLDSVQYGERVYVRISAVDDPFASCTDSAPTLQEAYDTCVDYILDYKEREARNKAIEDQYGSEIKEL